MKKYTLVLSVLLTSCAPAIQFNDVIVIGDSLCNAIDNDGLSYPEIAGVKKNCENGRKLVDYPDQLPAGFRKIFLSFGTNDSGTPEPEFRDSLTTKLASTSADVYCILPDPLEPHLQDVRQSLMSICVNTIEPREWGYLFGSPDGIHGVRADHERFGARLKNFLQN